MDKRAAEAAQTILVVVGVTCGLISLTRVLLGGEVGLWLSWLPGTESDPGRWLAPLVVLVVTGAAVLGVERAKRT